MVIDGEEVRGNVTEGDGAERTVVLEEEKDE